MIAVSPRTKVANQRYFLRCWDRPKQTLQLLLAHWGSGSDIQTWQLRRFGGNRWILYKDPLQGWCWEWVGRGPPGKDKVSHGQRDGTPQVNWPSLSHHISANLFQEITRSSPRNSQISKASDQSRKKLGNSRFCALWAMQCFFYSFSQISLRQFWILIRCLMMTVCWQNSDNISTCCNVLKWCTCFFKKNYIELFPILV